MGDCTHAEIEIGGDITRKQARVLATLLEKVVGRNTGDAPYKSQIKAAVAAGERLFLEDDQVNYARFGIEEKLVEIGISYDACWNSGIEFPEGGERFRPGMKAAYQFASSYGDVVVSEGDARRAIELIDQGAVDDARELLQQALGDDVVELPPLRIIED